MGFGSYDESEQQNGTVSEDEDAEGISVHEDEREGEVQFESNASTDDLVDQLAEIKARDEDGAEE